MIDLKTTRIFTLLSTLLFTVACGAKFHAFNLSLSASSDATRSPSSPPPGTTAPLPTPPPMLSSSPTAENTGIPPGTVLKASGSLTINTAGTVIDGLDIKGTVSINAANVTIKRSKITAVGFVLVWILADLKGVVIEDCELNGVGVGNDSSIAIQGPGMFLRNNIYNVETGISPESGGLVQDNYIHDLKASGAPAYNGVLIEGGAANIWIRHNTIINLQSQTSAVMIDNFFGAVSTVKVDSNLLSGGTYTVYSDGRYSGGTISGVSFTGNSMHTGKSGYVQFINNTPIFTGNTDDITGLPLP